MFNVLSKIKNRIGTVIKQPESVEAKPEAQEVTQPEPQEVKPEIVKMEPAQLEIVKVATAKKARKPRKEMSVQLQIILEVMELVRRDGHGRMKAIQIVAETRGISRSTVGDKCGRLLGLTSDTFDKMINSPDMEDIRQLMLSKWGAHSDIINNHIESLLTVPGKDAVENPPEVPDTRE
jgi:hypothetical protein